MLFKKKKPTAPEPDAVFTYPQTKNYRGFKRIKLTSYGYQPAQDGIAALSGSDLSDATITIAVFVDEYPRAVVSVGQYEVGTIWQHSFNQFGTLLDGKVSAVRLEIRDGESFLFYKV
jgi:hypothetical protein